MIAALSVGIYEGQPVSDLEYLEDSKAETDMNVVCFGDNGFIEIQGTGEQAPFTRTNLDALLELAEKGTQELFAAQLRALEQS